MASRRAERLKKGGKHCLVCPSDYRLSGHHLFPQRVFGERNGYGIEHLCEGHHGELEKLVQRKERSVPKGQRTARFYLRIFADFVLEKTGQVYDVESKLREWEKNAPKAKARPPKYRRDRYKRKRC